MSRPPFDPSSQKRKRPGTQPLGPVGDAEGTILRLIKSRGDSGMLLREIKYESKVPDNMCTKTLKALVGKSLIKEVATVKKKGMKVYMAAEFEPSKELSGGDWYVDGELDKGFIDVLKKVCFRFIREQKVSTLDGVYLGVKKTGVVTVEITKQQIEEILTSMVLDNDILEVKSTGLGDYYSIPRGTTCFRVAVGGAKGPLKMGGFASIPCGACPRIGICTSAQADIIPTQMAKLNVSSLYLMTEITPIYHLRQLRRLCFHFPLAPLLADARPAPLVNRNIVSTINLDCKFDIKSIALRCKLAIWTFPLPDSRLIQSDIPLPIIFKWLTVLHFPSILGAEDMVIVILCGSATSTILILSCWDFF